MYKHKKKDIYITMHQYAQLPFFSRVMYEYVTLEDHDLYFKGKDHQFHRIGKKNLEWHI